MKNRHFEFCRRSTRQYHRNKRGDQFDRGIRVRHDYGGMDPNGLSWWDDVQFIRGGMRITVAWRHPRQVFQDMIEEAAMKASLHLYEKINGDFFDAGEKSYKRLGRSRKKVAYYTMKDIPGKQAWLSALSTEEVRLSEEAEFLVVPSFKVQMNIWCRFVEIVAPVEVRNVDELRRLADLVRRILLGATTLEREFPGYVYSKAQWVADGLAGRELYLVSHRIAGT